MERVSDQELLQRRLENSAVTLVIAHVLPSEAKLVAKGAWLGGFPRLELQPLGYAFW